MVEKRGKFAALAELNRQESEPELAETRPEMSAETITPPAIATGKGRGRPALGKRSNPDYKLYSHLLKRRTQRAAVAKLHSEDSDRDLSDVLQELLEKWLKD